MKHTTGVFSSGFYTINCTGDLRKLLDFFINVVQAELMRHQTTYINREGLQANPS